MEVDIKEYFRYHPPVTEERKQKHEKINEASLVFAKDPALYPWYISLLQENIQDESCLKMAIASAELAALVMEADRNLLSDEEILKAWWEKLKDFTVAELFMFAVQQSRMFANQGITIDECRKLVQTTEV